MPKRFYFWERYKMISKTFAASVQPQEMSLHDVYVGSLNAKAARNDDTLQGAIDIYTTHKEGGVSKYLSQEKGARAATQSAALESFVSGVDANLSNGQDMKKAVKQAYSDMIRDHGHENVNGSGKLYNEWFQVYQRSFPIRGERETKEDMRELLQEPMDDKGYGEIAVGLRDPLRGKMAGGVQGLVVSEASAGMFTYAFLDPAYQGFGLSHQLLDATRNAIRENVSKYNPGDTRDVVVFLEKNKMSDMSLESIVLDSTGFSVTKPLPVKGQSLASGAISQSQRDDTWSKLGAKEIANAGYIQPSLDGVTDIKDKGDRALAIRFLQEDASLTPEEKAKGAKLVNTAIEGKAEHCPLALCAFVDKGATHLDLKQTQQFLKGFLGTSCLDTDAKGLKADIFASATMDSLEKTATKDGKLALTEVKPFGGPIPVNSFKEAENVTRALLQVAPLEEIRAAAKTAARTGQEKSYGEWLDQYQTQIQQTLKSQARLGQSLAA